jgi:hypothetical protein
VERLTFQRVILHTEGIEVRLLNDGPDPVTIAQVQIDEAFWTFTSDRTTPLRHLETATLRIPYPWVQGDAHHLKVLSSTGTAFEHDVPVAVATPTVTRRFIGTFTLIGLYVGVIPSMSACHRTASLSWCCNDRLNPPSISRSGIPSGWPRRASSPRWAAAATRTTTPSPKP